jgi:hypothetical protein
MESLLQAPLFVFLRRAALDRLPTLTAMMAGMIVFFWMVRTSVAGLTPDASNPCLA